MPNHTLAVSPFQDIRCTIQRPARLLGMWRTLAVLALAGTQARAAEFELTGKVIPETFVYARLHGATTPFTMSAEGDLNGRFRFRRLAAGTYTLVVSEPGHAEVRRTVEVSPTLANSKGQVNVTIDLRQSESDSRDALERRAKVSVRDLAIPNEARREYEQADKSLERRDVAGATAHLERAVKFAPNFSMAWNHLGTIAYQTGQYVLAESDFRKALDADPNAYEPIVNLGGVLINLGKLDEALERNLDAVRQRPNDALANSQLGMAYFYRNDMDLAEKYLKRAKEIDPAHFSHPQRLLSEIHIKRGERAAAAAELEDLLTRHPDLADAAKIKETISRLRGNPER